MADNIAALTPDFAQERSFGVMDLIRSSDKLKQTGEHRAAENLYAGWIQSNPDHPLLYAVLFNYAVLLTEVGALALARENLERCISLNADFLPAYINVGRIHERLGAVGQAV